MKFSTILRSSISEPVDINDLPLTKKAASSYDGWRVIEQRAANNTLKAAFVYGSYIDDVIAMYKPSTGYYFYHQDDQYNVTAVTDAAGRGYRGHQARKSPDDREDSGPPKRV